MSSSDEYEKWVEDGQPMSKQFLEWLNVFEPDWELEYSGDVWAMMKAFEAGYWWPNKISYNIFRRA